MFLNFILKLKARVRAGVDLTHFIAFSENVLADKETPAPITAHQKRLKR
jgi:hypothetical protein